MKENIAILNGKSHHIDICSDGKVEKTYVDDKLVSDLDTKSEKSKPKSSHVYNRKCHGYTYYPLGVARWFIACKCVSDTKQGSLYCERHKEKEG